MRPKAIVFYGSAPIVIHQLRAVLARPDTIAPMVFIGETPARPTQNGNFQLLQRIQYIVAVALRIRNIRILADPEAAIDATTEMLGKLSVNFFWNDLFPLLGVNGNRRFLLREQRESHEKC